MHLKAFIPVFLILFLLTPYTAAQELQYEIIVTLSEKQAHELIKITLNNTGNVPFEDFSYTLPGDAGGIRVYDALGNLNPEILSEDKTQIMASFRDPVARGEQETIYIEFKTSELISSVEDEHIFSAFFSPFPDLTKRFHLTIELPRGMGLSHPLSSGAQTDIAPLPDNTFSDGSRTIFEWNAAPEGDFAVFIRYSNFSTPLVSPFLKSVIAIILIGVLLVGVLVFIRSKSRDKETTVFMREDEKILIELIRENEGIVQKRLSDHTGFSKAKVSKIVSELESRDILRIEKIGRRNKLFLTEEFIKN
jgi:uncharacterized membrane protein